MLFQYCVPVTGVQSTSSTKALPPLEYVNKNYYSTIKTSRIYPFGKPGNKNNPTALSIHDPNSFVLEFDELTEDIRDYMVKIIHCNSNWRPSSIRSIDYLFEFNEFRISNYFLSLDTKRPYIHYEVKLPKVKISGNYLAVVYEEGYPDEPVVSKRFVIFENKVRFIEDEFNSLNNISGHRINFSIDYRDLNLLDPITELKATIVQNGRWDNAKELLSPTFIHTGQTQADFKDFGVNFEPGNEFRFFDLRSVISPGPNVLGVERLPKNFKANIIDDKSRNGVAYTFIRDLNGSYITQNFDSKNSTFYSEYADVYFTLVSEKLPGDIFIFGELTNWKLLPEARMNYDDSKGVYTNYLTLKQGWYDYQYYYKSENHSSNFLEGNHINTENYYEILIYIIREGVRVEELVGYYQFGINERLR